MPDRVIALDPSLPQLDRKVQPAAPGPDVRGQRFSGRSLVEMLRYRAMHQPLDPAYTFLIDGEAEGAALTWSALDRRSRAIAAALARQADPGSRAMLAFEPGLDFVSAFFGCLYAGVIAVPVQPPAGCRPEAALARLASIAADAAPSVWLGSGEAFGRLQRGVLAAAAYSPAVDHQPWISTDAVADTMAEQWCARDVTAQPIAFLQYTSGSTAAPKGVMVGHDNLLHNLGAAFERSGGNRSTVSVSWLPPSHDMGLIDGVLQPAFSGSPAYLMSPGAFLQRPVRWLQAISRYRATRSGAPNFAFDLVVDRTSPVDRATLDLGSWRTAYNGAEPVRAGTLARFASAFAACGFDARALQPCYGLAEATLFVAADSSAVAADDVRSPGKTMAERHVSCGTPALETSLAIVDAETDRPAEEGAVGEIRVSGPGVTHGYWRQPAETERVFRARVAGDHRAWLRTGDLGFMRSGRLFVCGRLKDLLIVRGTKHFAEDVEQTAVLAHGDIRPGAAAAFSLSTGASGDCVALVVEIRPTASIVDSTAIIAALRETVAARHGIRLDGVALVNAGDVPKTSSGKQQRYLCRQAWIDCTLRPLAQWNAGGESPAHAGAAS